MDRNAVTETIEVEKLVSLSARRAWIEIDFAGSAWVPEFVALRKESVDRNKMFWDKFVMLCNVALRKESVDRNNQSQTSS